MATSSKIIEKTPEQVRRIIAYGRMPQTRRPDSGLFSVHFKEDSFEIDFTERNLVFRSGARSGLTHELPLYYIDKAYFRRKQLVESAGITDEADKVEILMQYARLPLIDPPQLQKFRERVLRESQRAKAELVEKHERQALYDMFRLDMCDHPITFLQADWENGVIRLKARAPMPPAPTVEAQKSKKGRVTFFRDYIDGLCSDACRYLVAAFDRLPSLEKMEVTLVRMEPEPVEGLTLVQESEPKAPWQLRKFGVAEKTDEKPAKVKLTREERKVQKKQEAEEKKQRKFVLATSYEAPCDELFDGTLPYESILLTTSVPRQGFVDLQRSKDTYSALNALRGFDLRLKYDEEETVISPVESFF